MSLYSGWPSCKALVRWLLHSDYPVSQGNVPGQQSQQPRQISPNPMQNNRLGFLVDILGHKDVSYFHLQLL